MCLPCRTFPFHVQQFVVVVVIVAIIPLYVPYTLHTNRLSTFATVTYHTLLCRPIPKSVVDAMLFNVQFYIKFFGIELKILLLREMNWMVYVYRQLGPWLITIGKRRRIFNWLLYMRAITGKWKRKKQNEQIKKNTERKEERQDKRRMIEVWEER